jgi:hypothetical protein
MRDQEDFLLPWVGEADEATIIVVTSVGTSSVTVQRPAAGIVLLSYRLPVETWVSSGSRTAGPVTTENRHKERADGRQPTSSDGKWWASDVGVDIQVGPDERVTSAEARHVGGPGTHHSARVEYLNGRTTARLFLRGWTHPVSYVLIAQIERRQTTHEVRQEPPMPYRGGTVIVRIPNGAIGGRFILTLSRGRFRECDAGASVPGLILRRTTPLPAYTEYEYDVAS